MQNTAGPAIFKTPDIQQTASQISKNPGSWFKGNLFKIIIALLIIGVLGEVVFGAYSLFAPASSRSLNLLPAKVNELGSGRLSLVPEKPVYKKGDTVTIDVKLFTGGYITESTDLVVKYDPLFLKPSGKDFAVAGQIYSEYPAVQLDDKNGLIGISGITIPGKAGFSGTGIFAKLKFTALKNGQSEVKIDYQPDSTADSNVVLAGSSKDILGEVLNSQVIISDTGSVSEDNTAPKCQSFSQSCQSSTGKSGIQECSAGSLQNGSCGYDPRLTVSCGECKI